MKLQFWGVRGSVPTPGVDYLRYGGNTCCTAVMGRQGELIVIDAGTGFCQLGDALLDGPFGRGQGEMVMLLSHTHWDHILGFPFPAIIHLPGNHFTIYGPDTTRGSLETVCDGLFSPVYSPLYSLSNINARQLYRTINTTPFTVGNLTVRATPFPHGDGTIIWAYRIEEQARSLVYITDIRYTSDQVKHEVASFAQDADVLIHSAPYTRYEESEYHRVHCCIDDAIEVALLANIRSLWLFHHAPFRTDDQLDALLAEYRARLAKLSITLHLDAAREGPLLEV